VIETRIEKRLVISGTASDVDHDKVQHQYTIASQTPGSTEQRILLIVQSIKNVDSVVLSVTVFSNKLYI